MDLISNFYRVNILDDVSAESPATRERMLQSKPIVLLAAMRSTSCSVCVIWIGF